MYFDEKKKSKNKTFEIIAGHVVVVHSMAKKEDVTKFSEQASHFS